MNCHAQCVASKHRRVRNRFWRGAVSFLGMTHHVSLFLGGSWAKDDEMMVSRFVSPLLRRPCFVGCADILALFLRHISHLFLPFSNPTTERSGQAAAQCGRAAPGSGRRAQFARLPRSGQPGQRPCCRSVHQPSRQGRPSAHCPGLHGNLRGGKFIPTQTFIFRWLVHWRASVWSGSEIGSDDRFLSVGMNESNLYRIFEYLFGNVAIFSRIYYILCTPSSPRTVRTRASVR